MQTIIMTSDNKHNILKGFFHQWHKYFNSDWETDIVICGFTPIETEYSFYSIGKYEDYPAHNWSDAFIKVLDNVAEDVFLLLLDDYWLVRQVDTTALRMMYYYMFQFQNVIKFDVAYERLFAWGATLDYNTLGYLDLVKSNHQSQYHMSLWGGLWRRDLMREIIIPGESAQQIELNGTGRLAQRGDEILVLGTRQCPLRHANVIQAGDWNQSATVGLPALKDVDRQQLRELKII